MYLSIFSNVIEADSPAAVAAKTRLYGLTSVQLIPKGVGIGFGFDRDTGGSFKEWAAAYRAEDIEICGVGGYVNLLHPDPEQRRATIELFKSWLRDMHLLGCRHISTETGSLASTGDWDFHPQNRTPEAWDTLRRILEDVLRVAEEADAVILIEPYIVNVCHTPELGARLVREFGSPHLRMLMDPTNWFEVEMLRPEVMPEVIRGGFEAERGLFELAHAKDVAPPTSDPRKPALPAAGQGLLDYDTYLGLLNQHGYTGALVIEHLTEPEVPDTMHYVDAHLAAVKAADLR